MDLSKGSDQQVTDQQAVLSADQQSALNAVTEATNQFALDFYKALSKTTKGNVFASPLSLQVVLALVSTGARGKSYDEIKKVLGFPEGKDDMLAGYKVLVETLQASSDVLNLANKMFVDKAFEVKSEFQKGAVEYFKSEAQLVSYKTDAAGARTTINDWVEKNTNKKIKDLITEGVLTPDTVMVLVNAIHFKAKWKVPFSPNDTEKGKFFIDETNTVDVDFMHKTARFRFVHDQELKAKILELPYKGNEFSMFVILPDEKTGLSRVEDALTSGSVSLTDRLKTLEEVKVEVTLPKFTMTQTMDLNDILKTLGVKDIFDAQAANFSDITDETIYVSKVIQKAFVAVDEEGTEAAAATGMLRAGGGEYIPEEVHKFRANHRFVFTIFKKSAINSKSILMFIGNYATEFFKEGMNK